MDWQLNGQAIATRPDGSKFVGEFRDNTPNGEGTLATPDGTKYVGEFRDGKKNGQGTLTGPKGEVIHTGTWLDGNPVR